MSADPLPSSPFWGPILLQIVLILVNAFFSASEMSIISLNKNKIRKEAEDGDEKSARLLKLLDSPNNFLSTIQVAITLAGLLGSAFAAEHFAARLTSWLIEDLNFQKFSYGAISNFNVILITIILSYFTLVLGELVPKRIALEKPEVLAKSALTIIETLARLMQPVIWFLSKSTNLILRVLNIGSNSQKDLVTEEEIRMLVDIGEEKGTIQTNEREMIENIFEFNNISASDVMTHRTNVSAIEIRATADFILDRIRKTGLSRFPVYEADIDDIIGILNTREYLLNSVSEKPKPLRSLLRQPYFVPETVPADVLFRDMQTNKQHMAIVVDEHGGMSGIATMEDLLEEIVGNIYDEFDPAAIQDIIKISENLWRIRGGADLESINKELEITLPLDEEYDTLGGMIFDQFTTIPTDGTNPELDIFGLNIFVENIANHHIQSALVSRIEEAKNIDDDLNQ